MSKYETITIGGYRIIKVVTGQPWMENCYLVSHSPSGEQALIDPGDDADSIIQAILENGTQLQYILLTHAHHDHVGAVAALCRHFDLPCRVHKNDVRLLRHAPMYALRFANKRIQAADRIEVFDEKGYFPLGEQLIQVIHTPGHTAGSVCFSFNNFVFTGDTLLNQYIGRTDLPGGDKALLKSSVNQLLPRLTSETILFPGHGKLWTVEQADTWWKKVAESAPEFTRLGA